MPREDSLKPFKNCSSSISNGKISIIIATLNAGATLQACLNSVYTQCYPEIEIIIIDGKSTDNTLEIIKQNRSHISVSISEPDAGVYDAMNKGIKKATGKWYYFLGADDVLFADFSGLAFQLADAAAIYYGSVLTRGVKRFGYVSMYQMAKTGIFHQAIIYPASIFKKYEYEQKYHVFGDYAFNIKCYGDKNIKWIFKDYIIANFNHTGLSSFEADDTFEKDKPGLVRENFNTLIWLRFRLKMIKKIWLKKS
ncbi:glycosyltransferase family 2 protein [Mucilaginibacter gotjawali]|uniref:Glycosyltransferase involved in cell wall biosynthesis n=2 Tax=Mucilaginibacter gotjawali TaxID=1550579 RepID=A0A839SCV1_9SPHI|nr:glycosyltransferase family 2 protein [Mucilaginibacter gotjawali]MBB3055103.1 glycosyltransferase involved in cell wall biosynthesis [Mucilaginibacter gotjawali]BAU56279.1 PGL/p-HBAD biosynthesis glycosyltransferase/MT3031 [Mucilaginibacter gotjawali]